MPVAPSSSSLWLSYSCLILSMFILGSNIAIGKLVIAEIPVCLFAALRFLLGTLILLPGMLRSDFRRGLNSCTCRGLFLQSFFGCFLFSLLMLHGVVHTTAVRAGIIISALPSVIALLAWFWLREKIHLIGIIAIVCAMGGIVLVNLQDITFSAHNALLGNILVLGAVLGEALFAVLSRQISLTVHPWGMAFGINLSALMLFLPLAIPELESFNWFDHNAALWEWVIFYSISASVFSFLLWFKGISRVPANVAGLFTAVLPVSSTIIGMLLLDEQLSTGQAAGMLMVLFSIFLGTRKSFRTAKPATSNITS